MIERLKLACQVLEENEYQAVVESQDGIEYVAFDGSTTFGFLLLFRTVSDAKESWGRIVDSIHGKHAFALRSLGRKTWNLYTVLLIEGDASREERVWIEKLQEDLLETRKVVCAGIREVHSFRKALLPLLQFQEKSQLNPIEFMPEVRKRLPTFPSKTMRAFEAGLSEDELFSLLEEELQ